MSTADPHTATALGVGANASVGNSTALGSGAAASASSATAVGTSSNASQTNAVAVGPSCSATAVSAVSMGQGISNSLTNSVKIGTNAATYMFNHSTFGTTLGGMGYFNTTPFTGFTNPVTTLTASNLCPGMNILITCNAGSKTLTWDTGANFDTAWPHMSTGDGFFFTVTVTGGTNCAFVNSASVTAADAYFSSGGGLLTLTTATTSFWFLKKTGSATYVYYRLFANSGATV